MTFWIELCKTYTPLDTRVLGRNLDGHEGERCVIVLEMLVMTRLFVWPGEGMRGFAAIALLVSGIV